MKYLLKNLILFSVIFLALNYLTFLLDKGHTITYNIGNFKVKETLNVKNNHNYYFEIENENNKLSFQINKNYGKKEKILKNIIFKNIDNYKCYMPIFRENEAPIDIMCEKENIIYYAHTLNNDNINKTFEKYGYNKDKYKDRASKITVSPSQTLYKDNIDENTYVAVENYKGLNLFNGRENNIKLFENDIYKKPISIFTDKYYIVADYNSEYSFKNFHVINIINGEKKSIRSYNDISFDSYIQGVVDKEIYLFDKDSKKQYKINLKYETVEEVGNKSNIKYYDGSWKTITLNEALNEKLFNNYKKDIKGYDKVDKVDNYYYLYKKENDEYIVYRRDKKNKKQKTYLFKTTDLKSITYIKNKVYYKYQNTFYCYSEIGSRKLLTDNELEFNDDISFGVYEK